ncbi:hypothetical protein [Helicobacter suis]|nr:hypothetical protein [Helicobacter suis]
MRYIVGLLCVWIFLGCMGMGALFPMMMMSPLSSDHENSLKQTHQGLQADDDDDDNSPPTYYTRMEPVMLDTPQEHEKKEEQQLEQQFGGKAPKKPAPAPTPTDSVISSQDIHGSPLPNGVEIKRSDVLAALKNTQEAYAKNPAKPKESYYTLLNYCAKNDLFNELGAHLIINQAEQTRCKRMQKAYFHVLAEHYQELDQKKQVSVFLHDILLGCSTQIDQQKVLKSAFFKSLRPQIKSYRDKALLKRFLQEKPLDNDKLHALLNDSKLGERYYRCHYFINLP